MDFGLAFANTVPFTDRDGLTGLANRTLLQDELTRVIRSPLPRRAAVLFLDLDHFKKINDTHGHAVGDRMLKHLADLAKGTVRSADLVARWGGEEFVFLLPETGVEGALTTAERFREQVERATLDSDDGPFSMTISLGVLAVDSGYDGDSLSIMRAVDDALYQAKENGRNRSVVVE